jgi:hypothetical protein
VLVDYGDALFGQHIAVWQTQPDNPTLSAAGTGAKMPDGIRQGVADAVDATAASPAIPAAPAAIGLVAGSMAGSLVGGCVCSTRPLPSRCQLGERSRLRVRDEVVQQVAPLTIDLHPHVHWRALR